MTSSFPYSSIKVISKTTGKSASTVRRWVDGMRASGKYPQDECVIFTTGRTMLVNNAMLINFLKGEKHGKHKISRNAGRIHPARA